MKRALYLCLIAITLSINYSCKDKTSYSTTDAVDQSSNNIAALDGKKLMEQKCYLCHSPEAAFEQRIAPPMVAIKSHYLKDSMSKATFSDDIWNFVQKPTKEKSKMKGAVKRFGIMPYQHYEEKEVKAIAAYMYDYKIDEPAWFKSHIEEKSHGKVKYRNDGIKTADSNTEATKTPAEIGMEYALNTKKQLGKNLMGAIQKKGTLEAFKFCNVRAYPITDSMAMAQNATIKRVSDKPRNPKNQANSKELDIIEKFKKAVAAGNDYKPVTQIENGQHKVYYPIVTNSMCLQCHGVPDKDIQPDVFATINDLYPADKAKGYDVKQVRGMWAIEFKEVK